MTTYFQEWPDIMFSAKATVHGYHVDYVIYEITGLGDDGKGNYTVPSYRLEGGNNSHDAADTLDNAEKFAYGFVKWDGCSNWMIQDMTRNSMMQFP